MTDAGADAPVRAGLAALFSPLKIPLFLEVISRTSGRVLSKAL